ncbi:hypothetical protein SAMN05216276_101399 [Streptosporangium subroseum]|uniref:Uncharacterized protein n=1 Tax=Streptosporangium subroseum TaxID=106412 RepID=A0A239GBJ7_9ACTN|nr:hypothetical protein SAMN05216276_101399 [Streptosporangium subroseum]
MDGVADGAAGAVEAGASSTSVWVVPGVPPGVMSAKPAGVALMASTAPSTATDPVAVSSRDLRVVATAVI